MAEDRRSARRVRLSAVRATYEGAAGDRKQAEVFDLSRDGVFLKCESPVAVGKRLSLEILATGQPSPWPALGRVVWVRARTETETRPAGMAVKLIDVEDSVREAIDRLVQTREPTDRGVGVRRAPPHERTILGVGRSPAPEAPPPVAPVATVIVAEEVLSPFPSEPPLDRAASDGAPCDRPTPEGSTVEQSIAIELIPKKSEAHHSAGTDGASVENTHPDPAPAPTAARGSLRDSGDRVLHGSPPAPDVDRPRSDRPASKRRARRVIVPFFLLAIAAIVAYAYWDLLLELWRRVLPELDRFFSKLGSP